MARSHTAFFYDPDTSRLVADIAKHEDLVVFAGAGATIDRTGQSWGNLITELLGHVQVTPEMATTLIGALSVDLAASALTSRYAFVKGADWENRLRDNTKTMLYKNVEWLVGNLTEYLAQLLAVSAARHGSLVITTNYDDYLEKRIRASSLPATQQAKRPVTIEKYLRTVKYPTLNHEPGTVKCVYLHGYLPDNDAGLSDFKDYPGQSGNPLFRPVLSELEYARAGRQYDNMLAKIFCNRPVLIVGSSLTDPPLLRALAKRALLHESVRPPCYAIMSLQGSGIAKIPPEGRELYVRILRHRLEHLNVTPIYTDFYGQIGQFLHEISIAQWATPIGGYLAPQFAGSYENRLSQWSKRWVGADSRRARTAQNKHAKELNVALQRVRMLLKAPAEEKLKLELWVRWNPSPTNREFGLWASSVGTLADLNLMRMADIDNESPIISVRAFCNGRPLLEPDDRKYVRWKTYLAIPVRSLLPIGAYQQEAGLVVGVITLASEKEQELSSLRRENLSLLDRASLLMKDTANEILRPIR